MDSQLLVSILCLLSSGVLVRGSFVLTVKFINYTNPTGLCAECSGGLESVTSADQLTPVCCDESPPFRSDNCDNTGEPRCDTRFRWTLRPFGASLEMRPVSVPMAVDPPYHFTDCGLSPTTCPFSEISTTFSQGPTGFLGVEANPLTVRSNTFISWPGQVQFFIEAIDSGLPKIIDSLLINLDNLQLGADFTEEMTFTGYHNISHMTISFRVACLDGFCGDDCTVTMASNSHILTCERNGDLTCVSGRDPDTQCVECLLYRDNSTNCTTCLPRYSGLDCATVEGTPDSQVVGGVTGGVVGGVIGGIVGVALIAVVVVLVVLIVVLVLYPRKTSSTKAVNPGYEPSSSDDQEPQKNAVFVGSTEEHELNNPLYDTSPTDNDYSSPWDTRRSESDKPLVVTSSISTHAVVMRVNSNEPSVNRNKQSSVKNREIEYAEIDTTKSVHSYENTQLPRYTVSDYAEPPSLLPQPVYDSPDLPETVTTPTQQSETTTVGPYEYNTLPGFHGDQEERTFDNTGEHGVYRTYSPTLPPEAELHYDLGQ